MTQKSTEIAPTRVRYIKLGDKGGWERECLKEGIARFGFGTERSEKFELCNAGQWDQLKLAFLEEDKDKGTATRFTNELKLLWEDQSNILWVTFIEDSFCWGFFEQGGPWRHQGGHGSYRKVRDGWCSKDLKGLALPKNSLPGFITKLTAYRGTSCALDPVQTRYIVQRINGQKSPELEKSIEAMAHLKTALVGIIRMLDPDDFELLVDLVFLTSGWRRLSVVGGTQKTTDLDLVLPSTGDRAFVQVKSHTTVAQFNDYVQRLSDSQHYNRMFYVYHSSPHEITSADETITVIGPTEIAAMTINAGLTEWVMQKVS